MVYFRFVIAFSFDFSEAAAAQTFVMFTSHACDLTYHGAKSRAASRKTKNNNIYKIYNDLIWVGFCELIIGSTPPLTRGAI